MAVLCWYLYSPVPSSRVTLPPPAFPSKQYLMTHPSLNVFHHDQLLLRMRAEALELRPKKWFVFSINALKLPVIRQAKIEFYYSGEQNAPNIFFFKQLPFPKNGPNILIEGLTWSFYRNNQNVLSVQSQEARVSLRKRQISLFSCNVWFADKPTPTKVSRMVWNDRTQTFFLPESTLPTKNFIHP